MKTIPSTVVKTVVSLLALITGSFTGIYAADDFAVKVRTADGGEWRDVTVLPVKVDKVDNGKHRVEMSSVAQFDITAAVEVQVTSLSRDVESVRIRPLSYQVEHTRQGNTISFRLDRPRYLSIEVNGDIYRNLQLFANAPLDLDRYGLRWNKKHTKLTLNSKLSTLNSKLLTLNSKLITFGPGVHNIDSLGVTSGTTVYIDNDAVLKGWIAIDDATDVRILGNGIIDPGHHQGIVIRRSRNVVVDGPLTTQIPCGQSSNVTVRNAKVISWYGWGDGMNVFASQDVSYENVFCRTSDDCSTIYCTRLGYRGSCRNISVRHAVYWADVAHPIMIGLHGDIDRNETIEDVLYDDIDILENPENQIDYKGCFGINNGDNILVRRITFQNIRVEDLRGQGMLLNMRVCWNQKYCHAPGRGIEDITLRNISYTGQRPQMSIIAGYNEQRRVRNIRFENLSINGKIISDDMPDKLKWYKTADYADIFIGEHVEDVTFTRTDN